MRLVQVTDTHLCAEPGDIMASGINTDVSLLSVIRHIKENENADLLVASGDLAHDPHPAIYRRLQTMLGETQLPFVTLPGNHDDTDMMAQRFNHDDSSFLGDRRFENWQLVFLDTSKPGKTSGELGRKELERLEEILEKCEQEYLFIFLHHHPVPVGSPWMDEIALEDAAPFWELIDSCSCVKGMAFGHVHQQLDTERNGIQILGTPSTCVQFVPGTEKSQLDNMPPAYRTIKLHPDGSIETEVHWVESA